MLVWKDLLEAKTQQSFEFRNILGGYLAQSADAVVMDKNQRQVVSGSLSDKDWENLIFSWKVCSALKSNAISVTSNMQSVGLGMGQVNRVDAEACEYRDAKFLLFHPSLLETGFVHSP